MFPHLALHPQQRQREFTEPSQIPESTLVMTKQDQYAAGVLSRLTGAANSYRKYRQLNSLQRKEPQQKDRPGR